VGLSYCLEYLKLPLDQAYMRALQIAQFIETGQTPFVAPPTPSKREPGEDDPQDSIPY